MANGALRAWAAGSGLRLPSVGLAIVASLALVGSFLALGGQADSLAPGSYAAVVVDPMETITLQDGVSDTYADRYNETDNFDSEQTLKLRAGRYRILIQFDLSSLPEGVEVLAASLGLYCYDAESGTPVGVGVHQVLRPWLETEATWRRAAVGEPWEVAGCDGAADRVSTPAGDPQTLDGAGCWYDFDVTSVAQLRMTGEAENHGLVLMAVPASAGRTFYLRSAMSADPNVRPRLVITHSLSSASPTPTCSATPASTATPTATPTGTETAIPTSRVTPTPTGSPTLRPLQRIGVVAHTRLEDVDFERLNTEFVKVHDPGFNDDERSLGLDYCTVIRVWDRTWLQPSEAEWWAKIGRWVDNNPAHLWLIGNEPENPCRGNQSSRTYAERYKLMRDFILERDAAAQIGIGGVVLPSEIRRDWLDSVLNWYQADYGEVMPIDVWNIHNLLLSECPGPCLPDPPGEGPCPDTYCGGAHVPQEQWCRMGMYFSQQDQARIDYFSELIWEFRGWMKDRGFQDKPLIITEMGVFAGQIVDNFSHEDINQYMYDTFEFLMNTTDEDVGCPSDGYRLMQRWTWHILQRRGGINLNGFLFDVGGQISDFGVNFANYTAQYLPDDPTYIFFARGWTGYRENCDTTLTPGEGRPNSKRLEIRADGNGKVLLQFDLSILPTSAEVVSATLSLVSSYGSGGDLQIDCYGIKRLWEVPEANWSQATDMTEWEGLGCSGPGDRETIPSDSVVVTQGDTLYQWDVTDLAGQWVANPGDNHGVVLEADASGSDLWTFISSDEGEGTGHSWYRQRPKLELLVRPADVTPTPTGTATSTSTVTKTPTLTPTTTGTLLRTATSTASSTATPSATSIATETRTPTPSPTTQVYQAYIPVMLKEPQP